MPLLSWNSTYSVEIRSIDEQHRKLFDMVNELHDAMGSGKGSQVAPSIVKRLVAYALEHFAAEEEMMRRAKFPNFGSHKAKHDQLCRDVVKMMKDIEDGKNVLSMDLQAFLRQWLQTHILDSDKSYAACLHAAGIR